MSGSFDPVGVSPSDASTGYALVDLDASDYASAVQRDNREGRCFICEIARGEGEADEVYRDELCVAFFPLFPRLVGYTLVAPLEHRTQVLADFTEEEYLELQRRVHLIGRAISAVVPTERLYLMSIGSNQGIAHLHWHLAPLPPGVPFEQQQFEAVMRSAYLDIPAEQRRELAARIAVAIAHTRAESSGGDPHGGR